MNKKILFVILSGFLPSIALAQVTIQSMINAAVNTTFYIASGVIVILWVVSGIWFLTAQGEPEKLTSAKRALVAAVVGTLLVIIAASAINIVGSAFNIPVSVF